MGQGSGDNEARDEPSRGAAPRGDASGGGAKAGGDGRLLNGRYRLGDVVGRGGMGTVWHATDEVLGRHVAVKELRLAAGVEDAERRLMVTRTLREAKAIAAIRARGVVTIYDVVDEGDRPWLVMELIEGRSLADIIRQDGPMEPKDAARIGLAILDVLRAAHAAGILHRDVKPSNVLVAEEDGRVVLTDFGIAKVEGDPSVTSTGMLVGAPSYISPERAKGETPGPPADMWSLGALLYCCVEGRPPYDEGGAIATLAAVMHNPIRPPRHSGPLTEAITGLLVKDPAARLTGPEARALLDKALTAEAEPRDASDPTLVVGMGAAGAGAAAEGRTPPPVRRSREPATPPAPGVPLPAAAAAPDAAARRRTLIIAAVVVVVLAVIGAALAASLGGGDDNAGGETGATTGAPAEEDPATASEEPTDDSAGDSPEEGAGEDAGNGQADEADGGEEDGRDDPPGTAPENDPDTGLPGLPDGFTQVENEDFNFRIAMPEGWEFLRTAGQNSGAVYGPSDGPARLQVDFNPEPGDDAAQAWRDLEPAVSGGSDDYDLIGIETVEWRDYPTVADWEFTRRDGGQPVRVLDRGFRVDDERGYAVMITCAADAWDGDDCRALRETAFETFEPLD
ncbi:protein kinase [Streptomyces sp. NPDC049879]|uniref:serine/threonine-protein kinase n=1 Tax=Streptomyces sp. NPDC049879 TaxID=3365598 RepID=UPI0037B5F182